VKFWNPVSGELLKEIPGQILRPLAFLGSQPSGGRLVTVSTEGSVVTTWDEKSLEAVDHFRPSELGSKHLIGAALSQDSATLVTIADDRSVSLWDAATKQCFATLHLPSTVSASVFYDDACQLFKRPVLKVDDHFWEIVNPLKPVPKSSGKK
jgi:WD40 repeat protein